MDDLLNLLVLLFLGMLACSVIILPSAVLLVWQRTRRFALAPLALLSAVVGMLASVELGRLSRLNVIPCGNALDIPTMGLTGVATWLVAAFLVLRRYPATRDLAWGVVFRITPIFVASAAVGHAIGRYVG